MRQLRRSLSWLRVAEVLVLVLVGVRLVLEQLLLAQELDGQQREQVQAQAQVRQSRHHNPWQPLQASKQHHASTVCRRRFSIAGCRGRSASCQKQR